MCVYVCVCVHTCMHVHVCKCMCAHIDGPKVIHSCHYTQPSTFCFEMRSLLDWDLLAQLDWLMTEAQGFTCLCLPRYGFTSIHHHTWLFQLALTINTTRSHLKGECQLRDWPHQTSLWRIILLLIWYKKVYPTVGSTISQDRWLPDYTKKKIPPKHELWGLERWLSI